MCFGHEKKPSKRPQIKAMTHCVFLRPRGSHVNGGWSAQSFFLAQRGELGTGPEECPCAERKPRLRLGPSWLEQVSLLLCSCWVTDMVSVQGLVSSLQELFSFIAEWHIPTGSLIKNKNHNTVLQLHWLFLFLPIWMRRPLFGAFLELLF